MNCPICSQYAKSKQLILIHIDEVHGNDIPDGWDANHYYYYMSHGGKDTGNCKICGAVTQYDDSIGKPSILCEKQSCKDKMGAQIRERIAKKKGNDSDAYESDKQRKALEGRSIAGKYKWSDGFIKNYVGKMEYRLLWALDNIAELNSRKVFSPCPFDIWYNDEEGKRRLYIADIYIYDLNLLIEVKEDRENNPNTHPKILKVDRVREALKDKRVKELDEFNYYKYTGNNEDLLDVINQIRVKNSGNSQKEKSEHLYILNETYVEQSFDRLEEDLFVLLLHPKNNPIITDICLSYTRNLDHVYYFDMHKNEVVSTSIQDKRFNKMSGVLLKYTGEDKSLGSRLFKNITEYVIDDKEATYNQFKFFGELINLFSPNTIKDRVINDVTFLENSDFVTIVSSDSVMNIANYESKAIDSSVYLSELIEKSKTEPLQKITNNDARLLKEMAVDIPSDMIFLKEASTNSIIAIRNRRAVNIGNTIGVDINKKINILK